MTDLPYTEDDLRAEAARQHASLIDDPDYVGVGEQMEDAWVGSVETEEDGSGRTWAQLLAPDGEYDGPFDDAQRKIHDLINAAADLSEWAIDLGADGLEPVEHELNLKAGDKPIVRVHFAFDPDMGEDMRQAFVEGLGEQIAGVL